MSFGKLFAITALFFHLDGCEATRPTADDLQSRQQETLQKESVAQVGQPSIKNFREKKFAKEIYELRDQDGIVTYTYMWSDFQGKYIFFCNSVGYGLPYAAQFSNPQKIQSGYNGSHYYDLIISQAEPNGLFVPPTAEGTWIICQDPKTGKALPVYSEPRIIVSPFELPQQPAVAEIIKPTLKKEEKSK